MAPPAVATKVFLNDIPVQYVRPFEIRLSRGWEPWTFAIGVTDSRFDGLTNPVTIKVQTVSEDNTTPAILELEGWNITSKIRHNEFSYDLVIQDPRWVAESSKLSTSYNVTWWDSPILRQGSSDNGQPWTIINAITDALESFGLTVDPNFNLPGEIQTEILPNNLGPSPGGGFAGVPYLEAMPILTEFAAVDIVVKPNGHVTIVDRATDVVNDLTGYRVVAGTVENKDMHWSQPKRLEVLFPKRIERRFEYTEVAPISSVVTGPGGLENYTGNGIDNEIKNVIPEFSVATFSGRHLELYGHVFERTGYALNTVLQRIQVPGIFPWGDAHFMKGLTARRFNEFKWFEVQLQDTWRRRFRVEKQALAIGEVARPLANLKLGRLASDGTTSGWGGVHMNYVKVNRYSHFNKGKGPDEPGGTMFDALFSENVPFTILDPAPFDAQWMTDDVDELIFEVTPRIAGKLQRNYWPGELITSVQYGDVNDVAGGLPIALMEASVKFTEDFSMHVFYHGLQIADIGTSVEGQRMHVIRIDDLFPNGEGPTLQIKASNITANFGLDIRTDLPQQDSIKNLTEIEAAAAQIAIEVTESYADSRHGTLTFSTVQPLVDEISTGGNIFDTVIQIGFDQEFTCSLTYMIMPSVSQNVQPRDRRTGVPARIVEGG